MSEMPVTAPPAPVSVRERGYASSGNTGWWVDLTDETTPELRWPLSTMVFDKMRRQDAQVGSVLRAVTSPIIRTQWRIDGTGCDDKVTRFVAGQLGLPIVDDDPANDQRARLRGRDRFSWNQHLRLALLMLPFGHMFFEQVYRENPDPAGPPWLLRKLGPRMPKTIAKINVARDGGLISIEQWAAATNGTLTGQTTAPLAVNRLVAYVLEREGGNWLGNSLLRTAYKNWLLKDRALRTWSQTIDRQGMGVPVYTGPDGAAQEDLDKGEEIAADVRAGDDAGAALPYGATLKLLGVEGTLPDIEKFVSYHDQQIARSALGHVLNLGGQTGGQVGSYNLGSVLQDTLETGIDQVASQVKETGDAHVVEDLVDINFGTSEPAPQLVYDQIGTRQSELDRVREAAGLQSDAELVRFIRTLPPPGE